MFLILKFQFRALHFSSLLILQVLRAFQIFNKNNTQCDVTPSRRVLVGIQCSTNTVRRLSVSREMKEIESIKSESGGTHTSSKLSLPPSKRPGPSVNAFNQVTQGQSENGRGSKVAGSNIFPELFTFLFLKFRQYFHLGLTFNSG